jgi:hypothetical protein
MRHAASFRRVLSVVVCCLLSVALLRCAEEPESESCDAGCEQGMTCDDGGCIDEACVGVACPEGQACAAGACVQPATVPTEEPGEVTAQWGRRQDLGAACAGDMECYSNLCVDGVCCDTPCDGACEACDVAGQEGTCSVVAQGTTCDDGSACTTEDTCDGQAADGCTGTAVTCDSPPSQCHQAQGTCTDGACTYAPKPEGTACNDGNACTTGETCGSGGACGGGTTMACTTPPDLCFQAQGVCEPETGACTYGLREAGATCRVALSDCDVSEKCTGSSGTCPGDMQRPQGVACTDDGNVCTTDVCDATGRCMHPPVVPGTACGAGSVCNGSAACVAGCWIGGAFYAPGAVNPAGPCQVCNPGTSTSAWSNLPATTVCRGSAGVCDVAETCTGTGAACPADTRVAAGTVCRTSTGICDAAEACTGDSAACPADALSPSGTVCRASTGVCDVVEACTGSSAACPADALSPSGTLCRGSADVCDVAETCNGASAACPADARAASGTVCRAASGVCDVAEACNGSSVTCPADMQAAAGTVCRGSAGVCDVAETCNGSSGTCPGDMQRPQGTACTDDGNVCTTDVCDATGACLHPPVVPGTACGAGSVCNGSACAAGCWIAGAFYAPGAVNPAGPCQVCNPSTSTSAWSNLPASTVCRAAAGACDVAETCTGSSAACPADARAASGTVCRGSAGACDVAETCNGSSAACPADALSPSGTQCRGSAGTCDVAEYCNGATASCPGDGQAPNGTSCGTPSAGGWSGCSANACGGTGTQSRSVTQYACTNGTCGASTSTETQSCTTPTVSCPTTRYGSWSTCDADACGGDGEQSRSVTEYACSGGGCQESTWTQTRSCTRSEVSCPATQYGTWSTCDANACGGSGTQSRSVRQYACYDGGCEQSTYTEYRGCSRPTVTCPPTDYSDWSECFADACGGPGSQMRWKNSYSCNNGTCSAYSQFDSSRSCTKPAVTCPPTSYGAWSPCSADACGGTGEQSRSVTSYACSGGSCNATTTTETVTCTKPPVSCPSGQTCQGGACASICGGGGLEYCGGVCTDTQNDYFNCGACGRRCSRYTFDCIDGVCV